ncbi:ribonuclease P [Methanosarcinaceae archaeon]|nr:ribonuclease P [Methanosarcinaceae archaeon]
MNYHKKKQNISRNIAAERIEILFGLASENFSEHPERSQRYASLARLISMHYRVPIPAEHKRRLCRHCYTYLVPGNNCRVRLKNKCVLVTCFTCGKHSCHPYTEKRAAPVFRRKMREKAVSEETEQ